jgi:ABC-type protease/lipase transport system fused ATPase/permease subunit
VLEDDNTHVVVTVVFMLLFILMVVVGVVRCSLRSRKGKKIRKKNSTKIHPMEFL